MDETSRPRLPIGYWLKRADQLITERIDEVQRVNGLNRSEWQILHTLEESSSASTQQLIELLQPFRTQEEVVSILQQLNERGLIQFEDSDGTRQCRLTSQGKSLHETAFSQQQKIRRQAVAGIRPEDYETTIRVLQQIVGNLEHWESGTSL